jgi:glycosyltransferase involved in cell wall biosynthesis
LRDKICIVVSSAMTVNAFLIEPIKKLSKHYQVYIVVNEHSGKISEKLGNVTVLFVPIARNISPFLDLLALFKLINIFRKYNFKAVHSITPKAGLLAMLASFLTRISTRIHIFTGQVWITKSGLSRFLLKSIDRIIAFLATNILVDSNSQRNFLLDEQVVSSAKSSVLAKGSISGVDTVRFKPDEQEKLRLRNELAIKDTDIVFLFIGRLNKDKGVLELATAFSKITDARAQLLIVGPDEAGLQFEMELLLANCLERVHFVGFSSKPEAYMKTADVLCLPSYREGFGSVVIEAASVGIPAIGSRIYGVEDAIVDGYSGLLFRVGDADELRIQMMTFISDDELGRRLGNNARERVLEQFTSESLASAWLNYYQAIL